MILQIMSYFVHYFGVTFDGLLTYPCYIHPKKKKFKKKYYPSQANKGQESEAETETIEQQEDVFF